MTEYEKLSLRLLSNILYMLGTQTAVIVNTAGRQPDDRLAQKVEDGLKASLSAIDEAVNAINAP